MNNMSIKLADIFLKTYNDYSFYIGLSSFISFTLFIVITALPNLFYTKIDERPILCTVGSIISLIILAASLSTLGLSVSLIVSFSISFIDLLIDSSLPDLFKTIMWAILTVSITTIITIYLNKRFALSRAHDEQFRHI